MRRVAAVLFLVGIGASYLLVFAPTDPIQNIVHQLHGERWYRIEQNGEHIGFMHNTVNEQTLTTRINYRAPDAPAVTIHQQLHFGSEAPFALQRAAYSQRIGEQFSAVSVKPTRAKQTANTYEATIMRSSSVNRTEFSGQLKLLDMYAVELWLQTEPELGSTLSAPYPDFEKLQVSYREHRLLDKGSFGYELTGVNADSTTQTRLDRAFLPTKLTMAGRYDVTLSNKKNAMPATKTNQLWRPTTQKFSLDTALTDRHKIEQLELTVFGDSALTDTLTIRVGGLSEASVDAAPRNYMGENIDYPVSHPKIRRLVSRFARVQDDLTAAQELVTFTHSQLSYAEHQYAGTVLTALELRRGECTDFADLYTTLARSMGLPARTIYGLAYDGSGSPGFRFHAWNEVYADDRWHSVDPTWNQTITDATHIPLTDEQYADLLRNRTTNPLAFKVHATRYQTAASQ